MRYYLFFALGSLLIGLGFTFILQALTMKPATVPSPFPPGGEMEIPGARELLLRNQVIFSISGIAFIILGAILAVTSYRRLVSQAMEENLG